jgi:arabinan endo-1,5-alpha-L-arabinosidase
VGTLNGYEVDVVFNYHSGKCLDVYHASVSVGANVDQWTCNSGLNQDWVVTGNRDAGWVNYNSGLCLDVYQRSTSNGANVDQWTCNGGSNQLWSIPTGV